MLYILDPVLPQLEHILFDALRKPGARIQNRYFLFFTHLRHITWLRYAPAMVTILSLATKTSLTLATLQTIPRARELTWPVITLKAKPSALNNH